MQSFGTMIAAPSSSQLTELSIIRTGRLGAMPLLSEIVSRSFCTVGQVEAGKLGRNDMDIAVSVNEPTPCRFRPSSDASHSAGAPAIARCSAASASTDPAKRR